MTVLWYKTELALAALAAMGLVLAVLRNDARARWVGGWLNVPVCWIAARLLPWVAIYFIAGFLPHSDVARVFWPQARGVLAGGLPYRDFDSSFGPLFPGLIALPLLVWRDPRAIVLFLSVLEAVTVALTLGAARVPSGSAARARWLALYFLAPGPLLLAVVGGQEDFLLWAAGLVVWIAVVAGRSVAAGSLAVLGVLITKPLFAIPAAAFAGLSRRRWRYLAGAAVPALVVLGMLILLTGPKFLGVLSESRNVSPPNLWIWLHWFSGGRIAIGNPLLSFSMVVITGAFAIWLFARYRAAIEHRPSLFFAAWTLLFAVSMLVNLKSMGAYFGYFALPALALFLDPPHPGALLAWVVFGTLGPIESSLWYRTGERLLIGWPDSPWLALEYGLQGVMLICLIVLALAAHRFLTVATAGRSGPAS